MKNCVVGYTLHNFSHFGLFEVVTVKRKWFQLCVEIKMLEQLPKAKSLYLQ